MKYIYAPALAVRKQWKEKLLFLLLLPIATFISFSSKAQADHIVISQVYGGGGNTGATYKNDFIELFNPTSASVSLTGWSVQYLNATGTGTWATTPLADSIPAKSFYLIKEAQGSGGTTNLPSPDATGIIALGATSGKVILSNSTAALSGANPTGATVIDKVGFGSTATGYETAPAPAPDNTTAVIRASDGVDNNNNATDFTVAVPIPRNSTYLTSAPAIVSLSPADNSLGIPYNTATSVVFDKAVQKGTGNITIYENGMVLSSIDVTSSSVAISANNTVTINTAYAPGKSYYITIDSAAFKDVYGNNFRGITNDTAWNFTTYNSTVPVTLPVSFDFQNCTGTGLLPGGFTQYSEVGSIVWDCTTFGRDPNDPSGTAPYPNAVQINGFSGTNVPNTDWLISPSIDLTGTDYPLLSFWSRTAFNGSPLQLKISTDYPGTGDPTASTWTDLNGKFPALASNTWMLSSGINLSAFRQPNVHIAFVYTSSDEEGARWSVDDISLVNSPTPPPPSLIVGTADVQFGYVAKDSSAEKTFAFTGNDLTENVVLTSSGDFLLSKDGSGYSTSLTYTAAEANNTVKTVYIRFQPAQADRNFTDSVTITTSGIVRTVTVKGTSIDPATTLEVVNWNVEWFGSTTLGPSNDNLQQQNVETILKNTGADIYGLVEVVDESRLATVVGHLPGYSYVIGRYGSHVNPPEPGGGPVSEAQKQAFVYKTSLFSNVSARPLINNQDINSVSYNNWSSGRYPFLMTADLTLNGITSTIHFILVHAKANTSPTATSYVRRQAAAKELHDTIMTYFATDHVMVLGDFNDDLDQSITAGFTTTSYSSFTTDTANFFAPTLALSLAGKKSTVSYSDMIDHVLVTDELEPFYMPGTATVLTDVTSLVTSYASTTSDHYPVFTRYRFAKQAQTITFPSLGTRLVGDTDFSPATASSGLPVTYTSSNTAVAVIVNGQIHIVGTGTTEITAGQPGNSMYDSAAPVTHTLTVKQVFYHDYDRDTYGNDEATVTEFTAPAGYVARSGDCNDKNGTVYPEAMELADNLDNNCNGQTDEGLAQNTYYHDYDRDGYGNSNAAIMASKPPLGFVSTGGDCSDKNSTVYPGAPELADNLDNNCNGQVDEGLTLIVFYQDYDRDGYGNDNAVKRASENPGPGWTTVGGDCNDKKSSINPAATEIFNGMDDDCDGLIDEGFKTLTGPYEALEETVTTARIKVSAVPNPSGNRFSLNIQGKNNLPVQVRVTNILGSLVEQRLQVASHTTLNIGQGYRRGMYFVEVRQGTEREVLKLVKE